MLKEWRKRARAIKVDAHALYLAARDPRVPWYAKLAALVVAAYAVSPIDLIPDFIPVLGYLDDLVLVPAGIAFVVWLVPPALMQEHRQNAAAAKSKPTSVRAAIAIVALWLVSIALVGWAGVAQLR